MKKSRAFPPPRLLASSPSFLLAFLVLAAFAQKPQAPSPLLTNNQASELSARIGNLMESTAAVVPGLAQTSSVIAANTKQVLTQIQTAPVNAAFTYDLLSYARAYLALSDAMPKPEGLPDVAAKQFSELRVDVERLDAHFKALLAQKERQLRSSDRDNLRRYAEANRQLSPPAPNFPRIVFMGDSITDSWRVNEYFTGRDYINRGISGQVTGEMLGRMKADVIDLHPAAMLILAGTNDIALGVPTDVIENNLIMIGDLCRANGIKPLFASILPVSDYHKRENPRFEMTKTRPPATINQVNQWIEEYCRRHGYVYVDYFSAMRDSNGMLPADMADDGLHPNAKGYRVMAPIALKAIDQALSQHSPTEQPAQKKRFTLFGK